MNEEKKATRRQIVYAIVEILKHRRAKPIVDDPLRGAVWDFQGHKGRYRLLHLAGQDPKLMRLGKDGKVSTTEAGEILKIVSHVDLAKMNLQTLRGEEEAQVAQDAQKN